MNTGKQNRYLSDVNNIKFDRIQFAFNNIVIRPAIELYHGISNHTIPWSACLAPGVLFNAAILLRFDESLLAMAHKSWIHRPESQIGYYLYVVAGQYSGFFAWSLWQTYLHGVLTKKLKDIFLNTGLKNALGTFPAFISDKPIDESTRVMRLKRAMMPVTKFEAAKDALESALQVYIDEFKENRERGTVDITYALLPMPKSVKLPSLESIGRDKFIVGETRARRITADLNEIPHFLVGGQSGGGKSTFLRQLITTLYLNNKTYQFVLMDLKDGLEFQLFEKLDRVSLATNAQAAVHYLKKIENQMKDRMEFLKAVRCKDILTFLSKPADERRRLEKELYKGRKLSKIIVVIDEAAELFMVNEKAQGVLAQKAKAHAIKIAAQGRACGIHLIIATQRPEVRAVDGQIKANLSGAVAFQMPNNASSMTIVDSGRAAQLPQIKGRAIWKSGMEMTELQAPFMSVEETEKLLEPYRVSEPSNVAFLDAMEDMSDDEAKSRD